MKECYGYLFEIENLLRYFVENNMAKQYGLNWKSIAFRVNKNNLTRKDFKSLYFHELISYVMSFEFLKIQLQDKYIKRLINLNEIRNKIAHCHYLDEREVNNLYSLHYELTREYIFYE